MRTGGMSGVLKSSAASTRSLGSVTSSPMAALPWFRLALDCQSTADEMLQRTATSGGVRGQFRGQFPRAGEKAQFGDEPGALQAGSERVAIPGSVAYGLRRVG